MRAQNLTISVPYKGCDKNCPYCVSKMTGYVESDEEQFRANMLKARTVAKAAQVSSILITGKGEPFRNLEACNIIGENFMEFPIEIQTNGYALYTHWGFNGGIFCSKFLDVIAFSIDSMSTWREYSGMMKSIRDDYGIVVRVTLNMTDELAVVSSFMDFIDFALDCKVSQLSFRNIVVPNQMTHTKEAMEAAKWITAHDCSRNYELITKEFKQSDWEAHIIKTLPFGAKVYDVKGVAVTMFDECVQHSNHNDDIRSLIYQEDGHLYTSWDSPASILF